MSGSIFGRLFQISTWGESHGEALGVVVDGCPAGLHLSPSYVQQDLDRRKPGQNTYTTPRREEDRVQILSGVFQGLTTGTPISMILYNQNQQSRDYDDTAQTYRPGHADYSYDCKYGFRDYRGGGRSSGRETAGRVAGGAVARKLLEKLNIEVSAFTRSIGPVELTRQDFSMEDRFTNPLYIPDSQTYEKASVYLEQCRKLKDSAGGVIECRVTGLKAGIGMPVFDKLDALLSQALMSIGAVKGVEIGAGFQSSQLKGSENNDPFRIDLAGHVIKQTNHSGGITGGISDGDVLILRTAIKPTPSIGNIQDTVTADHRETQITISGRHDPVIVPRAVVVVEAMICLVLADSILQSLSSKMENVQKIYFDH